VYVYLLSSDVSDGLICKDNHECKGKVDYEDNAVFQALLSDEDHRFSVYLRTCSKASLHEAGHGKCDQDFQTLRLSTWPCV
jgi:hypothetical protein